MLTILAKIFKVLNSEQSPGQIAAGICCAAIIGLTPLLSLHNLLVILVVLWFRVNLTVFIVAWPLFSILGLMIAPISEQLGLNLLQMPSLLPIWEGFYNTVIGRWSNFYYGGVLGSLLIAILLAILLYPISTRLVIQYRVKLLERFEQYRIVKMLKASKFWQLYQSYSS